MGNLGNENLLIKPTNISTRYYKDNVFIVECTRGQNALKTEFDFKKSNEQTIHQESYAKNCKFVIKNVASNKQYEYVLTGIAKRQVRNVINTNDGSSHKKPYKIFFDNFIHDGDVFIKGYNKSGDLVNNIKIYQRGQEFGIDEDVCKVEIILKSENGNITNLENCELRRI